MLLFICIHSLKMFLARERSGSTPERRRKLLSEVLHYIGRILYWGSFVGFSPLWFPKGNLCVLLYSLMLLHLSFFQWSFSYAYDVMMLNAFIYCISIKNLTWYQSYLERSLCAAEIVLELQLLKIRVSSLKTLKYQK